MIYPVFSYASLIHLKLDWFTRFPFNHYFPGTNSSQKTRTMVRDILWFYLTSLIQVSLVSEFQVLSFEAMSVRSIFTLDSGNNYILH